MTAPSSGRSVDEARLRAWRGLRDAVAAPALQLSNTEAKTMVETMLNERRAVAGHALRA